MAPTPVAEQFAAVDATLLLVPMREAGTAALFDPEVDDPEPPDYLRIYRAICAVRARNAAGVGAGGSAVVVVAVDADVVADYYAATHREEPAYDRPGVAGWVRQTLTERVAPASSRGARVTDGETAGTDASTTTGAGASDDDGFYAADEVAVIARNDDVDGADPDAEVLLGADGLVDAIER
jgi:hypothetical protein